MSFRMFVLIGIFAIFVGVFQPRLGVADVWTSANGKYVAFHAGDQFGHKSTVSVWDFRAGKEKCRISHNVSWGEITKVAISEASGLVATVTHWAEKPDLHVWDLHTGEMLWSNSKPDDKNNRHDHSTSCIAIAFSPDGKSIATLTENRSSHDLAIEVLRSDNGEVIKKIENGKTFGSLYPTVAFSAACDCVYTYACTSENCQTIRCWDLHNGKILGDCKFNSDQAIRCRYGDFSVGAEFIVQETSADAGGDTSKNRTMLVVWDAKNRTEIRRIFTEVDYIAPGTISLFENRGTVFVTLYGKVCREYDLNTGEKISSARIPRGDGMGIGHGPMVPVPQSTAIIWSCSGAGHGALGISQFQQRESWATAATFQALKNRKDSAIVLTHTKGGILTGNPEFVGTLGVERVLDGEELWRSDNLSAGELQPEARKVKTLLAELATPMKDRGVKRIDRSKPRLFILGVGVSDHELDEKDLVYAASDARSLVEKLKQQHGSVYGDVQVKLYEDKQVTPASVNDGLNWLAQSSTERDVVVLFFSGHGMRGRKGLYYFTYHGDEENLQNTCVNWSDVAKSLSATKASQILFLSDCCHAGAFSKDHFLNQAELAKAIDSVENVAILASCSGEEGSLELDDFKHGAFTQALLEALDGAGDVDGDGNSTWSEIQDYVLVRVPKITGDEQHPVALKSAKSPKTLILSSKGRTDTSVAPSPKTIVIPSKP